MRISDWSSDVCSSDLGAIQYHFESKNDLVVAIMEAIAVELNFRFDVAELAKHPVEIRLDRMIEHYWRVFQTPMFRAGLSIWVALTGDARSEEHTSELQSLMRISYAVFCLKKKNKHMLLKN